VQEQVNESSEVEHAQYEQPEFQRTGEAFDKKFHGLIHKNRALKNDDKGDKQDKKCDGYDCRIENEIKEFIQVHHVLIIH
jgi:hypothetical protein